jgi:hypothetical protein
MWRGFTMQSPGFECLACSEAHIIQYPLILWQFRNFQKLGALGGLLEVLHPVQRPDPASSTWSSAPGKE